MTFLLWDGVPRKDGCHAQKVPARVQGRCGPGCPQGDLSIAEDAADFDISVESVKHRKRQADIDEGIKDGLTSAKQAEVIQLRRQNRRLEMENEILRRAATYFAKDTLRK